MFEGIAGSGDYCLTTLFDIAFFYFFDRTSYIKQFPSKKVPERVRHLL